MTPSRKNAEAERSFSGPHRNDAVNGRRATAPLLSFPKRGRSESAEPPSERLFRSAYAELFPRVVRWLVSRGADRDSASDLAQDVFVRAWERRGNFADRAALSGFVFACAKNLRIDRARRARLLEFSGAEAGEDAALADSPHASLGAPDLAYLRARLAAALDSLPEGQRECFTLSRLAECSAEEISRALGISENLVYARILLARKKLAAALGDLRGLTEA